ncbi:hypothetical protein PACTADRAFT_74127 [Pachysolen tannophilus NRRL Y-2460]|uniref:Protein kinase domain-containing protein n=1 Tax=Pachysolen tannophilus NRRL Y-2460 TaxID=669874 RepID=A0A1E4U3L2_PACTA|nr:hypothetical protein PACTADRAFT_74127 [Pachysolen tannophilus NRRL Y-2460]
MESFNHSSDQLLGSNKPNYVVYDKANFYIDSRYQVQHVLGKGSYGTVCSAVDLKSRENVPLAIKKVSDIFTKEVLLKRALRELKLMRYFKGHKNIINLLDLDIIYIKPYDGLYCFQELIDYDLARVIHSSVQFSEFHIQNFFYQILCGLKYIHSADVIHRDLKPGNILVTIQGTLKICDFGLARGINTKFITKGSKASQITNYVATRWYRAPELILSRKNYSKAVDMWAVGCILAELYGRRPLFAGNDAVHQITEIVKVLGSPSKGLVDRFSSKMAFDFFGPPKPQYRAISWDHIYPFASCDAHALMTNLLCWDAEKRYNVERCLQDIFVSKCRDLNNEPSCARPFDFSFENQIESMNDLKKLLHEEVESFKSDRINFGKKL